MTDLDSMNESFGDPDQIIVPATTFSPMQTKDVIGSAPVPCLAPTCEGEATLFYLSPTETWPNRVIACKTCRHVGWSLGQIPIGVGMNSIETPKD